MDFYGILNEIIEINGLRSLADKEKAASLLLARIKKEGPEGASELLEQILFPVRIAEAVPAEIILPESIVTHEGYKEHVNQALYRKLLPFAQLAYKFEEVGIAEEHAFKLAILFGNENEALDYLRNFAKQENFDKKSKQAGELGQKKRLMYDALLFSLPPPKCDFKKWRNLAKNNLVNKEFRNLLASADVLEDMIKRESVRKPKNKQDKQEEIKKLSNELSKRIKEFKKLQQKHGGLQKEGKKRHHALISEISAYRLTLAQAYSGTAWGQVNYEMLRSYYERYKVESQIAYTYFLNNGLTEKNFHKFCSLDRSRAGENIPDISINGADFGFPGFYLKKVNVQDDFEAARAACIGKLTNCCQSLSGEVGESCTIHGLTSPQGGFYMLLKGDIENPTLEDALCAATWAWRSKEGNIVLDSIEINQGVVEINNEMLLLFFNLLSQEIVNQNEDIGLVCCGRSSGISHLFGYPSGILEIQNQSFSDYNGYSDARRLQSLIAHKKFPFLIFYKDKMTRENEALFYKEMDNFLKKCAKEGNVALLKSSAKLLAFFNIDVYKLKEILGIIEKINKNSSKNEISILNEFENHFFACKELFEHSNYFITHFDEEVVNKILSLLDKHFDKNIDTLIDITRNMTLLQIAIDRDYNETVKALLAKGANPAIKDKNGNTALQLAARRANNSDIVKLLLKNDPNLITATNNDGNTVLYAAIQAKNNSLIEFLLQEDPNLANAKSNHGSTALHDAVLFSNLHAAQLLIQKNENLLFLKDDAGKTALDLVLNRSDKISSWLMDTTLIVAAKTGQLDQVKSLFDSSKVPFIPSRANTFSAISLAEQNGHLAVAAFLRDKQLLLAVVDEDLESIKLLLDRAEFARGEEGNTALHLAVQEGHGDIINLLLEHNPNLINTKNVHGETALDQAIKNYNKAIGSHTQAKVFIGLSNIILDIAAEKGQLDQVKLLFDSSKVPFIPSSANTFSAISLAEQNGHVEVLTFLQDKQLFLAIVDRDLENIKLLLERAEFAKDEEGNTALHLAAQEGHGDIIDLLIKHNPNLITAKNIHGETALDKTIQYYNKKMGSYSQASVFIGLSNIMLDIAAEKGELDQLKLLFDSSKVPFVPSSVNTFSAISLAEQNGHVEVVTFLQDKQLLLAVVDRDLESIKLLLERAEFARDEEGNTALHLAVQEGHGDIIDLLLKKNPDLILIKNKDGKRAIEMTNDKEIIHLFQSYERRPKIYDRPQKLQFSSYKTKQTSIKRNENFDKLRTKIEEFEVNELNINAINLLRGFLHDHSEELEKNDKSTWRDFDGLVDKLLIQTENTNLQNLLKMIKMEVSKISSPTIKKPTR